jgi:hypothetical protein
MSELPGFDEKFLMVYLESDPRTVAHLIHIARCEEQGGRVFLVGRVPALPEIILQAAGRTCALAWDEVRNYYVFDSAQELVDYFQSAQARPEYEVNVINRPSMWKRLFG